MKSQEAGENYIEENRNLCNSPSISLLEWSDQGG
jgi:hypothetical protein